MVVAFATVCKEHLHRVAHATLITMNTTHLQQFRAERLRAAIQRVSRGNETAFAHALGFKDAAFIRQMLKGPGEGGRTITEKTIAKIEKRWPRELAGWFSQGPSLIDVTPGDEISYELGMESIRDAIASLEAAGAVINSQIDGLRALLDEGKMEEHVKEHAITGEPINLQDRRLIKLVAALRSLDLGEQEDAAPNKESPTGQRGSLPKGAR